MQHLIYKRVPPKTPRSDLASVSRLTDVQMNLMGKVKSKSEVILAM